jgi:hypothetical protein
MAFYGIYQEKASIPWAFRVAIKILVTQSSGFVQSAEMDQANKVREIFSTGRKTILTAERLQLDGGLIKQ